MLVARYWASARAEGVRSNGRRTGLQRYGWSNESLADAQRTAQERADAAMARRLAGETVPHRERSMPYNAGEGVPIREEIIAELDVGVLTRNSYGAVCLNTVQALFVDVDFRDRSMPLGCQLAVGVTIGLGVAALLARHSALMASAVALVVITVAVFIKLIAGAKPAETDEARVAEALVPLRAWCEANPSWLVRVYRTPYGLRLLPMHDAPAPSSEPSRAFMAAMNADPRYVAMCQIQQCSRARLTPKSWRMEGGPGRLKPRSGRWPIEDEDALRRRADWVREYDRARVNYAACRFLETVGKGRTDPSVEAVRAVHDRWCNAESSLPIA